MSRAHSQRGELLTVAALALVGAFCAGVILVQTAIVLNTLRSLVGGS